MIYTKPKAGEWVQPIRRGYKLACCDCGLVHRMDFRIYKGRVQFRAFRNERSTGQTRRWAQKKSTMNTTSNNGNQQPSDLRGDPGATSTPTAGTRDPQSPHALPVSTVQALIEAESDHARIERQLRAEIDTLRGVRDDLKARLKAALLASPSFSDAQRVQELERKLHHEGIEHSEAQERIIKLEAHAVELEREVTRLKAHYEPEMCVLCPTCQPAGSKVPTSVCPMCNGAATIPKSRLT